MFALNKNASLSPTKQSPGDSPVIDPPSSASSASDLWMSPRPDGSSHGDMTSPEPRAKEQQLGKRTSVFTLRSRSNTGASTTSSFGNQSPPGMTTQVGERSSQDLRYLSSQSFLDISNSRRSLFRGKKGKRQSGAFSPGLGSEEFHEPDVRGKRSSVLRKSKRGGNQSEGAVRNLKHRISSPFDFQHLTHTDRQQFASMDQASENELVAEYWAVRASQAPRRDLTGIKAEDLHFQNFSSDNVATSDLRASSAQDFRSALHSPEPREEFASQESASTPPLRLSRSVESFSQPGVNPRVHRHTQSVIAPPRMSSLAPIHDVPEDNADSQRAPPRGRSSQPNRNSGIWDTLLPRSPLSSEKLPTMAEEPAYVGHAFTTPDDSAIHPPTPPFSPGLPDVAEEPERFVSPRPAPQPPLKSPKSPFFDSFSFSGPRSPIAKSNRRGSFTSPKSFSQRSTMTRPMSQMSETLGSPTMTRRISIRRAPTVRRKSNTWRAMEESWEDDIDYIYDNALEAECDLDWDRTSDDGSCERERTPEQSDYRRLSNAASQSTQTSLSASEREPVTESFYQGAFGPELQVSASSLPELESTSAISSSTADTGVRTPFEFFSAMEQRPTTFEETEGLCLTPSLLVPQEYKEELAREEMYEDLLASYDGSDRHFPFLDTAQSIDSSSRASHIRSSKRSSYDSSLMSLSGHGSGTWSSPVRRSASSSGSLPELVHSRRARRDFSMMVDDLSEQVASIASFGEEDPEDVTPPGCASPERTFFTSSDEPQPLKKNLQGTIENEVRASLELARQGSHRSSRSPPSHKYASSDGAAKMLASPLASEPALQDAPKTRARAATTSHATRGNRPAQLSLFPAPPKRAQHPLSPPMNATHNQF